MSRDVGLGRMGGLALLMMLASSCASESPTAPSPTAVHTLPSTIMIAEGEVFPAELTIAVGQQVAFMNHDRTSYTIAGGRGASELDCPEINAVGVLAAGDSKTTAAFTTAKTCDFQASHGESALVTGRIVVR